MRSLALSAIVAAAATGFVLAAAPAAQLPPEKTGKAGKAKAAPAAQPAKGGDGPADAKAEGKVNAVETIAEAYRLMDLAKEKRLPEVYVAAGRLFLLLDKNVELGKLDSTPKVLTEDDKAAPAATDDAKAGPSFAALADECLEQAELVGAAQKQGATFTTLVKAVRANPQTDAAERGALGGPRSIVRTIGGHQKHVHTIDFDTRTPGSIGFVASHPLRCHMEWNNFVHFNQVVRTGAYSWKPKENVGPVKRYVVTVHNGGDGPAQYRLFTN